MKADIGFIGLAVMGENLVLNMERNGYTVAVHNRTTSVLDAFLTGRGNGKKLIRAETPAELAASLERPRKIMMMIKAGPRSRFTRGKPPPHLDKGTYSLTAETPTGKTPNGGYKRLPKRESFLSGPVYPAEKKAP